MIVKPRGVFFLFLLLGAVAYGADAGPVAVVSFGPRFKEIRERIDALYQYRTGKTPPPDQQVNLFRLPAEHVVTPVPNQTPVEPPPDSEAILRQTLANLKGGIVNFGGTAYFVTSRKNYQEGDVLALRYKDKQVAIVIRRVTATGVMFALDTAEVFVSANQLK